MKHFLTSVFEAIVCIFLSVPVCSGDEAARNRKAIRIILTTTHNTPRLERSLGSDIKAYVCEDTGTIEVELYEVRQADICIIDSKDNTVDYCTTNGQQFVMLDMPDTPGTYLLVICSEELYAEGIFTVE